MQRSCALVAALILGIPAYACPQSVVSAPAPANSSPSPETSVTLTPEFRGDLAMARGEYTAAIADYRETSPKSPEVWDKMGMAWHHLFALDEARRDYQQALRLRPDYPAALNNLGAVYYSQKDYRRSLKYYRKALRLEPGAPSTLSNLGTAYFALGKTSEGLDAYRAAFAINPHVFDQRSALMVVQSLPARDRAQQDYCLARIFAANGHNREAIDYLRRALNEGLDGPRKLLEDQMPASLCSTAEFSQLMAEEKLR
ncbi:MAG TPA: tetratricopeptide repeat protein [Acidobacteriaceae bacterium]|jgi:tetratricopeptide (TPR) repeat protein|nr:tetratricopeptide repeat protein [Acidobacteriaceae bacterium]